MAYWFVRWHDFAAAAWLFRASWHARVYRLRNCESTDLVNVNYIGSASLSNIDCTGSGIVVKQSSVDCRGYTATKLYALVPAGMGNRFFMKLFQTSNIDIVKRCQSHFCFDLPSVVHGKSARKFDIKYRDHSNRFCQMISHLWMLVCNSLVSLFRYHHHHHLIC